MRKLLSQISNRKQLNWLSLRKYCKSLFLCHLELQSYPPVLLGLCPLLIWGRRDANKSQQPQLHKEVQVHLPRSQQVYLEENAVTGVVLCVWEEWHN